MPGDQPTALVAEPVGSQLPSLVLLHHIATGGALELAQLAAVQERQWRLDADLLGQLLDRRIDPRVAGPLIADAGLDLAASVLAVTRAAHDRADAELHRKLARSHLPHLLLNLDRVLHVVLPEAAIDAHLVSELAGRPAPRAAATGSARPAVFPTRRRRPGGRWASPRRRTGCWSGTASTRPCCCRRA